MCSVAQPDLKARVARALRDELLAALYAEPLGRPVSRRALVAQLKAEYEAFDEAVWVLRGLGLIEALPAQLKLTPQGVIAAESIILDKE